MAAILSAAMLLEHLGLTAEGSAVRDAVNRALTEGIVTEDLAAQGERRYSTSRSGISSLRIFSRAPARKRRVTHTKGNSARNRKSRTRLQPPRCSPFFPPFRGHSARLKPAGRNRTSPVPAAQFRNTVSLQRTVPERDGFRHRAARYPPAVEPSSANHRHVIRPSSAPKHQRGPPRISHSGDVLFQRPKIHRHRLRNPWTLHQLRKARGQRHLRPGHGRNDLAELGRMGRRKVKPPACRRPRKPHSPRRCADRIDNRNSGTARRSYGGSWRRRTGTPAIRRAGRPHRRRTATSSARGCSALRRPSHWPASAPTAADGNRPSAGIRAPRRWRSTPRRIPPKAAPCGEPACRPKVAVVAARHHDHRIFAARRLPPPEIPVEVIERLRNPQQVDQLADDTRCAALKELSAKSSLTSRWQSSKVPATRSGWILPPSAVI